MKNCRNTEGRNPLLYLGFQIYKAWKMKGPQLSPENHQSKFPHRSLRLNFLFRIWIMLLISHLLLGFQWIKHNLSCAKPHKRIFDIFSLGKKYHAFCLFQEPKLSINCYHKVFPIMKLFILIRILPIFWVQLCHFSLVQLCTVQLVLSEEAAICTLIRP